MLRKLGLLAAATALTALACAPRHAVTTWGYSAWYERSGGGSMGAFEAQQHKCLEAIGAAQDPGAVAPNSPEETAFLECMNVSWCTNAYNCQKPPS